MLKFFKYICILMYFSKKKYSCTTLIYNRTPCMPLYALFQFVPKIDYFLYAWSLKLQRQRNVLVFFAIFYYIVWGIMVGNWIELDWYRPQNKSISIQNTYGILSICMLYTFHSYMYLYFIYYIYIHSYFFRHFQPSEMDSKFVFSAEQKNIKCHLLICERNLYYFFLKQHSYLYFVCPFKSFSYIPCFLVFI